MTEVAFYDNIQRYLIAYKVLLTTSHIGFHQRNTTLVYVLLEVTIIHSQYVQITYVNPLLSSDAYFVFSDHY